MQEFIDYLSQQLAAGKAEIAALEADGRKDDANFAKAKNNIYDVCRTVTQALIDRPGFGADAVKARFDGFRSSWGAALQKAQEHGDVRGIAVEEAKLSALEDVISHFPEASER